MGNSEGMSLLHPGAERSAPPRHLRRSVNMPRASRTRSKTNSSVKGAFQKSPGSKTDPEVHIFGNRVVCDTEPRGHPTPQGRSPLEIVVDASEGFIPLWASNMTLR